MSKKMEKIMRQIINLAANSRQLKNQLFFKMQA